MFDKFLFQSAAVLMTAVLLVAPVSAATITHGSTSIIMDFVTVGNTDYSWGRSFANHRDEERET